MNRSRAWAPLAVLALVQSLLFAYYLRETMIRQPYWDMYSHVVRFLQLQRDGAWWAFAPATLLVTVIAFSLYVINTSMESVFNPRLRK